MSHASILDDFKAYRVPKMWKANADFVRTYWRREWIKTLAGYII